MRRLINIEMEQAADAILQAARETSPDELSDVEVDGDGSSSLSEIEYRDLNQDDEAEASDARSNESEDENDSEAETERLEQTPKTIRTHNILSANNEQVYERSPSKLNKQIGADDEGDEDEDDALSEDNVSLHGSHKGSAHGDLVAPTTAETLAEDSSVERQRHLLLTADADTRKRKRSIMAGSGLRDDIEEPLRKRLGSVMASGNEYTVEDEERPDEEADTSNPISGNITGEEGGEHEDDVPDGPGEPAVVEEEAPEPTEIIVSPKKRGRKKKKTAGNGISNHDDQDAALEGSVPVNGEEEMAENEGDGAEAALKNEEERKSQFWLHLMLQY